MKKLIALFALLCASAYAAPTPVVDAKLSGAPQLLSGATLTLRAGSTFMMESGVTYTTPFATRTGTEALLNKRLGSLTTNGFVTTTLGDGTLVVISVVPVSGGGTNLTTIAAGKIPYATALNTYGELSIGNTLAITTGTLDTIQDIRTTATPQWTRLGLGMAADASRAFSVTGNGYVSGTMGIGVTTPVEKLEVDGAIKTAAPTDGTAAAWKLGSYANGRLEVGVAGTTYKLFGTTAGRSGTVALVAGTQTISDAATTTNTRIRLAALTPAGTPGALFISAKTATTGFVITSTSATDTSTVYWEAFEP